MRVKYIGKAKEVVNIFGVFKKDTIVEVDDNVGNMLIKAKNEFENVDDKSKNKKEIE